MSHRVFNSFPLDLLRSNSFLSEKILPNSFLDSQVFQNQTKSAQDLFNQCDLRFETKTFQSFASSSLKESYSCKSKYQNIQNHFKEMEMEKPFQPLFFYGKLDSSIEGPSQIEFSPKKQNKNKPPTSSFVIFNNIQAMFFNSCIEKEVFLDNFDERSSEDFPIHQIAFSKKDDCLFLRNLKNLKEKKVYLRNILEVQMIQKPFSCLSFHILKEGVNDSIVNLHFHLLVKTENSQVFCNFVDEKLKTYGKNIIFNDTGRNDASIKLTPKEKIIQSYGAVPSSPPKSESLKNLKAAEGRKISKFSKFCNENEYENKEISVENKENQQTLYFNEEKQKKSLKEKENEEVSLILHNKENEINFSIEKQSKQTNYKSQKYNDNNKKEHDSSKNWKDEIRESFKKSVDTLMKGFAFKKYGLHGWKFLQPQKKIILFSPNMGKFLMVNEKKWSKSKVFSIEDILEIKDGRNTKNFMRFSTNSTKKINNSFSLLLKNRSLDFEAKNEREKNEFCKAMKTFLFIYNNCTK